jgi:hypothetical protein
MFRTKLYRFAVFTILFASAIGAGSALHLPALAASEYAQVVAPFTSSTCTSPMACLLETDNGSGPGVKGVSAGGSGAVGQTQFKSTSQSNGVAGVLGQDKSASGTFDSGVKGTSVSGIGVEGTSTNGNGVQAFSTNGSALFVENTGFSDGIQSIALGNDGTNTSTQNNSTNEGRGRSGLWGHDDSTDGGTLNYGVTGSSTYGTGVYGASTNYVGVAAVGGGGSSFEDPALSITSASSNSVFMMAVCSNPADVPCTGNNSVMYVDYIGNVNTSSGFTANGSVDILGQYLVNGTCVAGCSETRNGKRRIAQRRYVPTATMPSVEDFGVAQLVNGDAHVALNSDFANVIDQHAGYLVFVTPEGDTNGLYIAQKNNAGFDVRENRGGHSTVAFEWRIVARPYATTGSRLPMVEAGMGVDTPRSRM